VTRGDGAADDCCVCLLGGGGYVNQHFTSELVASSHLPTYEYRLFVVRQCRKITTQKCTDTQETCCRNWPVGAEIGDIVACC